MRGGARSGLLVALAGAPASAADERDELAPF
jgi:hypothetical protein